MRMFDHKTVFRTWSCSAVLLSMWALFIVRKTLLLFIFALLFAHLLSPLVSSLHRGFKFRTRIPALMLSFGVIALMLVGAVFALHGPVHRQAVSLQKQVKSDAFKRNIGQWRVLGLPVGEEILDGQSESRLQNELINMMPQLSRSLSRVGRDIANLFIVPILAFFLLKDERCIYYSILELFLHSNDGKNAACIRRRIEVVLNDAYVLILQYMRALMLLCFAVLIIFGVMLRVMNVPYWLLLTLLAFLLEFIPLVGPLLSGIAIVAACKLNEYPHLAGVICFLLIYRMFQDYVLSPILMKHSVNLHPLAVIFGVFAGAELGGIPGIFLSVPLLSLARLIFHEYRKSRIEAISSVTAVEATPWQGEIRTQEQCPQV